MKALFGGAPKRINLKDATPEQVRALPESEELRNKGDERRRALQEMIARRKAEEKEKQKAAEVLKKLGAEQESSRYSRMSFARMSMARRSMARRVSSFTGAFSVAEFSSGRMSTVSNDGGERRVSRVMRHVKTAMRSQMVVLNGTLKNLLSLALFISMTQGVLQVAWHVQLANILAEHTTLLRSYNLIYPPSIWHGAIFLGCLFTLCYVRRLDDQALLRGLRKLLGGVDEDGEDAEDAILEDFKNIIDGLNEKLDLIGSQGEKVQNVVSSLGGFAENAKRLAERLIDNRQEQFEDEQLRKSLVENVSDVCYEFFMQMRDGRPRQLFEAEEFGSRTDAEVELQANLSKVEMVREVNRLIRELKRWSSTTYEADVSAGRVPAPAHGRDRGLTPCWASPPASSAAGPERPAILSQSISSLQNDRSTDSSDQSDGLGTGRLQLTIGDLSGKNAGDGGGGTGVPYDLNYHEGGQRTGTSSKLNWKQARDETGQMYYYVATYERPTDAPEPQELHPSPPPSPPPPPPPSRMPRMPHEMSSPPLSPGVTRRWAHPLDDVV